MSEGKSIARPIGDRIRIKLGIEPHSAKQYLIVNALFIPGLLEMWIACGTKYGKTISLSTGICAYFPLRTQALFRWIAPFYNQSKIGYTYCKRMLPAEPHVKANESSLSLSMPYNDSTIQYFHGQKPEAIEGEATSGNVLDEAAKLKEAVYSAVKTTTTVTRGPIIGASTPLGKNWFYKKCMEAKEEMIRAKHEGRRPTKIFIHAPTTSNPYVSQAVIDDARKTLPTRLFKQYYEAEFVDDGSVFTNVSQCYTTDYIEFFDDQFQWIEPIGIDQTVEVVIGVDWAKTTDFTVFTAWCIKTRRMVGIWRMQGQAYPMQVKRLKTFAAKFHNVHTVWHDKTGVGVALDDMLAETNLPYHGVVFSNASKNEMFVNLMLGFENESIGVPHINYVIDELNGIEVSTTPLGLPMYAAGDGQHDDIVMSMILGHSAMLQHCERDYGIIEL